MIELRDVSKIYQIGNERVRALDHVNLHVHPHEFVSVIGPSGSGKSTLMNIIGCLDVSDQGAYCWTASPSRPIPRTSWPRSATKRSALCFRAST